MRRGAANLIELQKSVFGWAMAALAYVTHLNAPSAPVSCAIADGSRSKPN
jgi:hypothetical protein